MDKPQLAPAARRRTISRMVDQLSKSGRAVSKKLKRGIAKLAAEGVAQFHSDQLGAAKRRRRANIEKRERRDDFILKKRNPVEWKARQERRAAASGLVAPVFE